MDLADEISYSFHDLEDAISLGMITKELWLSYFEDHDSIITACHSSDFEDNFINLADNLFSSSHRRKKCIGKLINLFITSVEVTIQNDCFEHDFFKYQAVLPQPLEAFQKVIFDLVREKVIKHENVQQLEFKGQKLVVEIYDILCSDPKRFLPSSTKERYNMANNDEQRLRVICDFISGITDDYATRFYEKLVCPRRVSIFDRF